MQFSSNVITGNDLRSEFKQYQTVAYLLLVIAAVILLLFLKSLGLAILFVSLPTAIFVLILYPEFGLALALTSNVLLMILFDYFKVAITAPVVVTYLLLVVSGTFFYLFQKTQWRTQTS